MKLNLKSIICGIIIGSTITGSIPVMARSGSDYIDIVWRNIKICVDGVQMTPRDSAGKELEPFIYNGTTYLPVRAVAEAVGKDVTWDSTSSTVYIGKSGGAKYLEPYQTDSTISTGIKTMGGKNYKNSIELGENHYAPHTGQAAYYNLNCAFKTMNFVYGIVDGNTDSNRTDGIIYIYGDDRLIKKLECKAGALPQNVSIDVTGIAQIKVQFGEEGDKRFYGCIGDVMFQ